jgi:polyisoprenoid-binding protein YceI
MVAESTYPIAIAGCRPGPEETAPMTTFQIDPAHTDVLFTAKHMMVTNVRGKFTEVAGTIELDEAEPTRSTGEIRLKAASIDSGFDARDGHLRSADFFDAENHPEIVIRTTGIRHKGANDYVISADVTIRGTTKSVELETAFLGFYQGMDGSRRVGFSAETKINRKDWGLNWNVALEAGGWLVGDSIKIEVELAAQEAAVAEEAAA